MVDSKVYRCKCGEWLYEDQECTVCDILDNRYKKQKG